MPSHRTTLFIAQTTSEIDSTVSTACGYALLEETDTALTLLRRLASLRKVNYRTLSVNTELDHLRSDPRFIRFLEEAVSRQLPWERFFESPDVFEKYSPNLSCELKVADPSTLWTEVKYNFAYFDRLQRLDWDSLYLALLPTVSATESTSDYYRILRRAGTLLHDDLRSR